MKESTTGHEVYCQVIDNKHKIVLKYKAFNEYYTIEMPKTEFNKDLKIGQEVELMVQRLME